MQKFLFFQSLWAMEHRVIDNCRAFHGRAASREQVQIEISFPAHQQWGELFKDWWRYGFTSWRRRAGPDDSLVFVCELGPKPWVQPSKAHPTAGRACV
jgi:hypothetical protein